MSKLLSRLRPALLLAACVWLCACCASPPAEAPGGQTPGGQTPGDQTPGGQTPGGQTPGDQTPGGQTPAVEVQAADPLEACAALDELGCLDSTDCTLRQGADGTYACSAAANDCERGFVQRGGRAQDCPEGCVFEPARCYCAPDVECVCGGGPPAQCSETA